MRNGWDGGPQDPGNGKDWKGWLSEHSERFDKGVSTLKARLDAAFEKLAGGGGEDGENPGSPSDPQALAEYQTALSEYTTYRSLQSNSAKSLSDMQKQNARNLG